MPFTKSHNGFILGDPGAVSRVDKMFVVKVYCKIDLTVNFHHEHFIDSTNCPWVSEDVMGFTLGFSVPSIILADLVGNTCLLARVQNVMVCDS